MSHWLALVHYNGPLDPHSQGICHWISAALTKMLFQLFDLTNQSINLRSKTNLSPATITISFQYGLASIVRCRLSVLI